MIEDEPITAINAFPIPTRYTIYGKQVNKTTDEFEFKSWLKTHVTITKLKTQTKYQPRLNQLYVKGELQHKSIMNPGVEDQCFEQCI